MKITLTNCIHNTQVTLKTKTGWLSKAQLDKAWKYLCGIESCTCGGYAGERGKQRWILDYQYTRNMDILGAYAIDTEALNDIFDDDDRTEVVE